MMVRHGSFFLFLVFLFIELQAVAKTIHTRYADEIVLAFEQEMARSYDLISVGSGGNTYYDVDKISVMFHTYRKATIEEARELEVKAIERLCEIINSHERIRPYLRNYPIQLKNIDISITFLDRDSQFNCDGSVAHVFLGREERFVYSAANSMHKLIELAEEPSVEAFRIVHTNLLKPQFQQRTPLK